jgi:hypothetical protein
MSDDESVYKTRCRKRHLLNGTHYDLKDAFVLIVPNSLLTRPYEVLLNAPLSSHQVERTSLIGDSISLEHKSTFLCIPFAHITSDIGDLNQITHDERRFLEKSQGQVHVTLIAHEAKHIMPENFTPQDVSLEHPEAKEAATRYFVNFDADKPYNRNQKWGLLSFHGELIWKYQHELDGGNVDIHPSISTQLLERNKQFEASMDDQIEIIYGNLISPGQLTNTFSRHELHTHKQTVVSIIQKMIDQALVDDIDAARVDYAVQFANKKPGGHLFIPYGMDHIDLPLKIKRRVPEANVLVFPPVEERHFSSLQRAEYYVNRFVESFG